MDKKENKISFDSDVGIFTQLFRLVFPKKEKPNKKEIKREENRKNATRFEVDISKGLDYNQVNQRIQEGLDNHTPNKYTKPIWRIIVNNLVTYFNILMVVIAIILLIAQAPISNIFFLGVVGFNILIGIVQEIKTKITVDKLRLITDPKCEVIRNGKKITIKQEEVVLDDILIIKIGDQLSSDSIVLEGEVEVNESALTGESLPIKKKKGDLLLSNSFVVSGSCISKVEQVGLDTFSGKLSSKAKQYKKSTSVLKRSINAFISIVSIGLIPIGGLMIYTNYISSVNQGLVGYDLFKSVAIYTSASIIGMIPSGLVLLVSAALCVGVMNLASKNTSVQDLYSIERLARVTMLCLDKTGTLTDGSMILNNYKCLDNTIDFDKLMSSYLACFDTSNQTSLALIEKFKANKELNVINKLDFSSARKYSAVTFENNCTYALGAYEFIFKDTKMDKEIEEYITSNMNQARRVIVIAKVEKIEDDHIINPIKVVGLFAIEDHIRKEAFDTINWFKQNNVKIKIISGDNPLTVSNIAKKCGVDNASNYVSLEGKSEEEVAKLVDKYTVFGRVTPSQKELIVKTLKQKGEIVAMTGDGVNDIPAMKASDCSIAMNNGSDATKGVAHLVLLDSNFANMPQVVKEGRRVINNIQFSSSLFLMKTIFVMLLNVFVIISGLIINNISANVKIDYPFIPSNMLILEVLIIGMPSFFLALQPNENLVKGNFMGNVFKQAVPSGLSMFISVLFIMLIKLFVPQFKDCHNSCLEVLVLTFVSLASLIAICYPYNLYRRILVIVAVILNIVCILFLPERIIGIHVFKQMDLFSWYMFIVGLLIGLISYIGLKFLFSRKKKEQIKE